MESANLQSDNHFVPELALRQFCSSPSHIWAYRILVSRDHVPNWRNRAIKGVAYYSNLYTRIVAGNESDELEKWFNSEFETPAKEPLEKVAAEEPLTQEDWRRLVWFLAAQDLRTPARLSETQRRWDKTLPAVMDSTLKDSLEELKRMKESGELKVEQPLSKGTAFLSEYIPMRVTTEIAPGAEQGKLKLEILAGRGLWLYSMKYLLTNTLNQLSNHNWTILKAPTGLRWFSSDDPVIRLNYYNSSKYDFEGGWGKLGTEIILPLNPRDLLYTRVGHPAPSRTLLSHAETAAFRKMIAEHAWRMIYSVAPDDEIPKLRPRRVDPQLLEYENAEWKMWHENQSKAEREFMGWSGSEKE